MDTNKLQLMGAEFDAANKFSEQLKRHNSTPVVDDDYPEVRHRYEGALAGLLSAMRDNGRFNPGNRYGLSTAQVPRPGLTFDAFREANVARCLKWHPSGIASWSPSDWLTAVTGELGELASLLKMRNRERDGLPGNKFSPTDKMLADELADVLTYLDLLAYVLDVNLGRAAVEKFNEVSERVGFPERLAVAGRASGEVGQ